MSINVLQFRELTEEVLQYLHPIIPYSITARELLMLTAATESHLGTYVRQVKGPALGVFQMEPATEKCIWDNFLHFKPVLKTLIQALLHNSGLAPLKFNLAYQIAMARVHYFRKPAGLPKMSLTDKGSVSLQNVNLLAAYWKKWYNTDLGKGTPEKAARDYINLVGGIYAS